MNNSVLLLLVDGFDDMSLLSCQVIFEENNYDIIIASREDGTIKGDASSVIAVSFKEVIEHNEDYKTIILIGGKDFELWDELGKWVENKYQSNTIIIGLNNGVDLINKYTPAKVSSDKNDVKDNFVFTLKDTENVDEFIDRLIMQLGQ